jgi:hypothetical protein
MKTGIAVCHALLRTVWSILKNDRPYIEPDCGFGTSGEAETDSIPHAQTSGKGRGRGDDQDPDREAVDKWRLPRRKPIAILSPMPTASMEMAAKLYSGLRLSPRCASPAPRVVWPDTATDQVADALVEVKSKLLLNLCFQLASFRNRGQQGPETSDDSRSSSGVALMIRPSSPPFGSIW